MKKTYLFLLMVFLAIGSGSLFAQQRVLDEGFETTAAGALPTGWTQEPADAAAKWTVEKDNGSLSHPASCATGTGRIKLKATGASDEVLLISPAFDNTRLAASILVFDYAAIRPNGGVADSLKVYYRLASNRPWTLVKSYGEADTWTRDTIDITQRYATFQIAFGVAAKDGALGVALDNIHFSSRPICTAVTDVEVYNKIHTEAKIRWSGSLSADYNVVISTKELVVDPASAVDGVLLSKKVSGATNIHISQSATQTTLEPSTQYWYYIQSDCGYGDVAAWVSGSFTTACPPVEGFNTSFEAESGEFDCWTTIGEDHGVVIATRPNIKIDSVMTGVQNDGTPSFRTLDHLMKPHTGSAALWMPIYSRTNYTEDFSRVYAVSPRLVDGVNLKEMQLSFWLRTNNKSLRLRVIVSEWPDDFTNAQASGEISVRAIDEYEQVVITFEDMEAAAGKYIVFMLDGSKGNYSMPECSHVLIDDLEFKKIDPCSSTSKVVMFTEPEMDGTSTTLSWNRSGAVKYNVKISTGNFNPVNEQGTFYNGTVDDPELPLTDLAPATRYYYYVQPICADGTPGTWSNTQYFDTECSSTGLPLPLRENFDGVKVDLPSNYPLPVCWTVLRPAGSTKVGAYLAESSGVYAAYSPYNYVASYPDAGTIIVTPRINADLKDCQVRLAYKISQKTIPIEIGVMTNPDDASTFEKVSEVVSKASKIFTWETDIVKLSDYTGYGKYVAFRLSTANVNYALDDIVVEEKSPCGDVADIRIVSTTDATVQVDWTPSPEGETSWDVAYTKAGAPFSTITTKEATAHPYTIEGLDVNVSYDIYVRSSCGAGKGLWIGPVQAKTNAPATLDYSCDFEDNDKASAWNMINGIRTNQWIIGDAVASENNNTGRALYISKDYGVTNSAVKVTGTNDYVYAARMFELEAGLVDIEFDWRLKDRLTDDVTSMKYSDSYIMPFLVPADIEIVGGNYTHLIQQVTPRWPYRYSWSQYDSEGWICLKDSILVAADDDWHHFKATYPLRKGGRYNLVILYNRSNYATGTPAAVDNISVKVNSTDCITPVDLVAYDVAQYSAKVSFVNYNATEWKVVVTDSVYEISEQLDALTTADPHVAYADVQDANPIVLTDLNQETRYTAYIRPVCGGSDTWASVDFRTICETVTADNLPITFSFDEEEFKTKTFMDCWRRIPDVDKDWISAPIAQITGFEEYDELYSTNMTQMLVMAATYYSYAGTDDPVYIASPELSTNLNELMLSMRTVTGYDYTERPAYLEVGAMSSPTDTATFEVIDTIKPLYKGEWKTYTVYLDGYTGTAKHIAFRMSKHLATVYIDDLKVGPFTGCVPARAITVSDITANTANVSWKVIGAMGDYHVKVMTEPMGRWEDKANVYDGVVKGDNKLPLTGLRTDKQYYVYVRAVCEDGSFTEGISEAQFRTDCGAVAVLPYREDFETYEVNTLPDCWYVLSNVPDGGSHLSEFSGTNEQTGTPYKQLGRLSLQLQTGANGLFPAMIAMPAVSEDVKDLKITFQAMQYSRGGKELIVGVVSDVNDKSTFVAVDTITCAAMYTWEEVAVDFSSYTGSGKYITFFLPATSSVADLFIIDEVSVRKANVTCPDASAPQAIDITSNSAILQWAFPDGVDAIEVKVASQEINPETDPGDVLPAKQTENNSEALTDLAPATHYYAYVRNVCGDGEYGYWSSAAEFITLCDTPEDIPYDESFTGYGEIADQGFFPVCWRRNVTSYGSISPSKQPEPYIENSNRQSLFMKAAYDSVDGAYAVVDAITPVITFGEANAAGHMMEVTFKSTLKGAPIYVGLVSDPSDVSTFVAYDTLRCNAANEWETNIVNFIAHPGAEQHIAFRINSQDAKEYGDANTYTGYQVNITDIHVNVLPDCMPPYRVKADARPNRAFISWVPGDKNSDEWKYYYTDASGAEEMIEKVPFTDEEFRNLDPYDGYNTVVIDSTREHRLTINGLSSGTSYYFFIKTKACDAFYPQIVELDCPSCSQINSLAQLPVAPDFMNNGLGIGSEPEYSSFFDCWTREDDFVGDKTAYPYITEEGELLFHTVVDSVSTAYLPKFSESADKSVVAQSQFRFTAKGAAEGAKIVIGTRASYDDPDALGCPAPQIYEYNYIDTIDITTEWEEYIYKFEDFEWVPNPDVRSYNEIRLSIGITNDADVLINDFSWEAIPHCYTPALTLSEYDNTSFEVTWEKLDDQENWEVAYAPQGFNPDEANHIARTDTFYNAVNLTEGTPYEFYVRANCGNGMTGNWGRICVTTDQTPATYPYSSADFADATYIDADDSLYYAYRTVELPAGPHDLTFDWKVADATGAYLRVFTAPADEMITGDTTLLSITETSIPDGWSEVATLKGTTTWTAATYPMYVKVADAGTVNVMFVWTKAGAAVSDVVKNVNIAASTECTVPDALNATQITATSAVLNWVSYNANSWTFDYWETADKNTLVTVIDNVNPGYLLSGLKADTEYSFQVYSDCKDNEPSEPFTFRTACEAVDVLLETFDEGVISGCWSQYHGLFDEVVADPNKLIPVEEGWNVTDIPMIGSDESKNARLTISGDDCANWLVTPVIRLDRDAAISFNLSFAAFEGLQPVSPNGQTDDRFIVAVSTDEGKTWSAADATIWDNAENVNKILNRIGNTSRRIEIDLSPYTGKSVRVGFYGESTVEFESNDIHIDSVALECRDVERISDNYCSGYTYEKNGFKIDREDLTFPGVHKFVRREYVDGAECNKTVVLTLTLDESKEYVYQASFCEGELYSDANFKLLSTPGTHTRKMQTVGGCDSVIVLELTMNPSYALERSLEIDATELPYTFACHEFPVGTVSGEYEVECETAAGCDSIITLTLTVNGGTAVDNVEKDEVIVLTPNPVRGGELVTVNYDFSADELRNLVVTVYNSVGQVVEVSTPAGQPVAFNAPNAAGVYTVRIATGTDRVLLGRFIVR